MAFKPFETVVLAYNLPEHQLRDGDIGTVVMVHEGGAGHEVEFATLDGETLAVVTLSADQVRPVSGRQIAHARSVAG